MDLAVESQPLLRAQADAVRAAHEMSVAAGQLPDPTLSTAVVDLTLTGPDRFTLMDESDTQFLIGIRQAFPGGAKRALRGELGAREAERLQAEAADRRGMVRRETALAWLEAWKAIEAQAVVKAAQADALRQQQAVEIAYRSGRGQQADLIGARVSAELLADQLAGFEQAEWHARNRLRRWVGDAADRPLCPDLPVRATPDLLRLLGQLGHHPAVLARARAVAAAEGELALAKEEYKPDWSVQLGYGYRPGFADYASVNFEVGLPVFRRNRQDRGVAARSAQLSSTAALQEDFLRQIRSEIQLNVHDWERLRSRIRHYDEVILPQAAQRAEAAVAAYGGGTGSLLAILDARRSLQDARMQRLDLTLDATRHLIDLDYFALSERQS